jgi:DNA-binding NarL/FixJ family response regulator
MSIVRDFYEPFDAPRSVLVVEDDALLRELLAVALERHGFIVETAASAPDARRAFNRGDHDAVVLDVSLGPGPTGFDLADVLRQRAPHLAIVFLTNLPDPRFAERDSRGLPNGVAYLRKTNLSDVESVVEALDATLRGRDVSGFRQDNDPDRPLAVLTRKQITVLRLAANGLTNQQIADNRGVTIKAIEDTISRAAKGLAVDSKQEGNIRVAVVRRFLAVTGGNPPAVDSGQLPDHG